MAKGGRKKEAKMEKIITVIVFLAFHEAGANPAQAGLESRLPHGL